MARVKCHVNERDVLANHGLLVRAFGDGVQTSQAPRTDITATLFLVGAVLLAMNARSPWHCTAACICLLGPLAQRSIAWMRSEIRLRRSIRGVIEPLRLKNPNWGEYEVELSPEGLRYDGCSGACRHAWTEIELIVRTSRCVLFVHQEEGSYAVPQRSIGGRDAFDAFVAEARSWRERAVASAWERCEQESPPASQHVDFELNADDICLMGRRSAGTNQAQTASVMALVMLAFFAWVLFSELRQPSGSPDGAFPILLSIMGMAITGAMWFVVVIGPRRTIERRIRSGLIENWIGRFRIAISPDGVAWFRPARPSRHPWSDIARIDCASEATYYFDASGQVFIVPARAFRSVEERRRFDRLAWELRKQAVPHEKTCPRCQYDLRGATRGGCPECGWRRPSDDETESVPDDAPP